MIKERKIYPRGPINHYDDSDKVVYIDCASCSLGMHNRYLTQTKKEIEKNSFVPKKGEIVPVKVGEWISDKKCPDCGKKTIFRASEPKLKFI